MNAELLALLREASASGELQELIREAAAIPEPEKTPAQALVAQLRDTHVVHPVALADVLDDWDKRLSALESTAERSE